MGMLLRRHNIPLGTINEGVSEKALPFVDVVETNKATETTENKTEYTKTEINRMSTADLKELAKANGLDDGMSGAEIKKALIEKFEL